MTTEGGWFMFPGWFMPPGWFTMTETETESEDDRMSRNDSVLNLTHRKTNARNGANIIERVVLKS
jgi:hypothetical protein